MSGETVVALFLLMQVAALLFAMDIVRRGVRADLRAELSKLVRVDALYATCPQCGVVEPCFAHSLKRNAEAQPGEGRRPVGTSEPVNLNPDPAVKGQ